MRVRLPDCVKYILIVANVISHITKSCNVSAMLIAQLYNYMLLLTLFIDLRVIHQPDKYSVIHILDYNVTLAFTPGPETVAIFFLTHKTS